MRTARGARSARTVTKLLLLRPRHPESYLAPTFVTPDDLMLELLLDILGPSSRTIGEPPQDGRKSVLRTPIRAFPSPPAELRSSPLPQQMEASPTKGASTAAFATSLPTCASRIIRGDHPAVSWCCPCCRSTITACHLLPLSDSSNMTCQAGWSKLEKDPPRSPRTMPRTMSSLRNVKASGLSP